MNDRRVELLDAYRQHRFTTQKASTLPARAERNEAARQEAVAATGALLMLAALFGGLATADVTRRALWAFEAACMSALGTALTSYEAAFVAGASRRPDRPTARRALVGVVESLRTPRADAW